MKSTISDSVGPAASTIEAKTKARGISVETFLPSEFFYVRQDSTPKAPVTSLIAWGLLVYLALGGAFGLLFLSEYTKETIVKETTIEALPITGKENIECKGLSTLKGSFTSDAENSYSPYLPMQLKPGRKEKVNIVLGLELEATCLMILLKLSSKRPQTAFVLRAYKKILS
ncbi:hypothetical protein TrST_g4615 [Triparma strigata]|uniref:Uncharacterized protein n=1 Tax=Triparma strigata TaxID=1606541 RepID=A0A9W7DQY6_9STRA|nr:hypothetical protein TrST_g4615 [Triparma strigata]